jgi:hypothetical protein
MTSLDGSMFFVDLRGSIIMTVVLMTMVNFCLAQQLFYLNPLMNTLDVNWMHHLNDEMT